MTAALRPTTALLDVEDVRVTAGDTTIVDGVSFALAPGERVGLIGESGSGKSLTALAVMGLLPEELRATGQVTFDGRDLMLLSDRELGSLRGDRIAMVFQEPMTALNPLMRVGRQVTETLSLHRALRRSAADNRALELLTRVELPDPESALRAYPHQLSGGQRQRVMLAMALACDPAVLICDEPTTALDVTVQARMLRLIDRLVEEEGSALLFITHDLAVVSGLCQRVLVMYGGHIVESGPTRAVFAAPRHPYTVGLLDASAATTDARRLDERG
ncbi:MAG TPA: ABC transporter ATP-binding protein, partial [Acidimicrobiales bacterium]